MLALTLSLPLGGAIEVHEALSRASHIVLGPARGHQGDAVAGGKPINFIPHFDSVGVGQSLRQGDLEFAGNFAHKANLGELIFIVKGSSLTIP